MPNLMGNWRNREGRRQKEQVAVNVIYFGAGVFTGIILMAIAFAK